MLRRIGLFIRIGVVLLVLGVGAVAAARQAWAGAGLNAAAVRSGPPTQQEGRPLGRSDWLERAPLALACLVLVVVVDTVVVVRVVRKRRQPSVRRPEGGPPM